jgi:hypothetical protein
MAEMLTNNSSASLTALALTAGCSSRLLQLGTPSLSAHAEPEEHQQMYTQRPGGHQGTAACDTEVEEQRKWRKDSFVEEAASRLRKLKLSKEVVLAMLNAKVGATKACIDTAKRASKYEDKCATNPRRRTRCRPFL